MKEYRDRKRKEKGYPTIFNAWAGMKMGFPNNKEEHDQRVAEHGAKRSEWYENTFKDAQEKLTRQVSEMYMKSSSPTILPKRKTVRDLNKKIQALQLDTPKSDKITMNTGNRVLDILEIKAKGRKKSKRKKSKRKKSKRKKSKRRKSRRK